MFTRNIKFWGEEKQKAWQKQKHEHGGISSPQVNMIYALSMKLGARDMLQVLKKTEKFLQGRGSIVRRLASLSNLTKSEANAIIEAMKSRLDRDNDSNVLQGPGSDKRGA